MTHGTDAPTRDGTRKARPTRKQRAIVRFVRQYEVEHEGEPPKIAEVATRFGICVSTAQTHLEACVHRGLLSKCDAGFRRYSAEIANQ